MVDEMRERLIEVFKEVFSDKEKEIYRCKSKECSFHNACEVGYPPFGCFADAILADGWIRPKFKVGQTVWVHLFEKIYRKTVTSFVFGSGETYYTLDNGYNEPESEVFATKAEAQAALEALND